MKVNGTTRNRHKRVQKFHGRGSFGAVASRKSVGVGWEIAKVSHRNVRWRDMAARKGLSVFAQEMHARNIKGNKRSQKVLA